MSLLWAVAKLSVFLDQATCQTPKYKKQLKRLHHRKTPDTRKLKKRNKTLNIRCYVHILYINTIIKGSINQQI